jgi:hypothetical protein
MPTGPCRPFSPPTALLLTLSLSFGARLAADEGMFTFDNPPLERLAAYGFRPRPAWLESVRLASVRFMDGGSGAFVSADGLLVTNHHVALSCIQNLSDPGQDHVKDGFLARSRAEEPACPGYEVNVLVGMEDVTARVLGEVKPEMTDKAAADARKAAAARIENECAARTGLRCDLVKLYQGGEYQLYRYKKYTDVRLVFAPEQQIAFFGGDSDNFTYPRHDLDVCFFRAYEDGKPARPAAHLTWSEKGANDGDLVFVSGHPGYTARFDTVAQLVSDRDVEIPDMLAFAKRRLALLHAFAAKSPEHARRAKASIFGLENAQKSWTGSLTALQEPKAMAGKEAEEKSLRERVAALPAIAKLASDSWGAIAAAVEKSDARMKEYRYVGFLGSRVLGFAGTIVRYVEEVEKPNEVRLEEFVDAALPSLRTKLFSKAPLYADLEEETLTQQLEMAREALGPDHPFVKAVLQDRTPAAVAKEAVAGTTLADVAARQALVEGGRTAVAASTDSMIVLARRIDPVARALRRWSEDEVKAVITRASERIAQARWKLYGKTVPPDATFTLRLSYGFVKGYPAEGTEVPARTTFHGLYDRSASWGGKPPWDLPERWRARKDALDLATPLNFVTTNDIVGGNSGSPVIDRDGAMVGLVFDGNIQSLGAYYFYTEEQARTVCVDARGIVEALRNVFEADALVKELIGPR